MTAPRTAASSPLRSWKGVLGAVVILILLGAALWAGVAAQSNAQQPAQPPVTAGAEAPESSSAPATAQPEQPPLDMSRRIEGDPMAMGSVDAPVVLVEYSDFRCPFCALYARDTQPTIIKEYVETGQVRLEWRDMPLFGQQSADAAVAARAASEQNLFWEFSEAVFAAAPERGHAELPQERLVEIAQEIGIPDLARFERDMIDPELVQRVAADSQEGFALGVTGTPTFLVNEIGLSGAQPIDTFRTVIDEALARAEN